MIVHYFLLNHKNFLLGLYLNVGKLSAYHEKSNNSINYDPRCCIRTHGNTVSIIITINHIHMGRIQESQGKGASTPKWSGTNLSLGTNVPKNA